MMIHKQEQEGVSPVIGVILMVAITVIIAAVVASFVLDLGGTLSQDADATVNFAQEIDDFQDEQYEVTVTTQQLDNADYTYVQIAGDDISNFDPEQQSSADDTTIAEQVPSEQADFAMVGGGDRVIVGGLSGDEDIQVMGGLDGEENQIAAYSVEDPQGWA